MPNNLSDASGYGASTQFDAGVPQLTDTANIVDAFKYYHYGPNFDGVNNLGGIESHLRSVSASIGALDSELFLVSSSVATNNTTTINELSELSASIITLTSANSASISNYEHSLTVALSDETTTLSAGSNKLIMRAPYGMNLVRIPRASLNIASATGNVVLDINVSGSSILSTKLSIDANEKTSTTAAVPAILNISTIADDAEVTFDIDSAGSSAKGLKVTLYYVRT